MRLTISTDSYNARRYSKPWIGRVCVWGSGRPDLDWGNFLGAPGDAGVLEVFADAGDIIRWGQKDNRNPSRSGNSWGILQADGSVTPCDEAHARECWLSREAGSIPPSVVLLAEEFQAIQSIVASGVILTKEQQILARLLHRATSLPMPPAAEPEK